LLTITLIAFSLVADGLRDALDPKALDQKYV
jgi:ABC-type dipeptide/oligopeptide/nickel transport system permease subunit